MTHLFCFGLGYSSLTLAKQLLAQGWRVSGTCRSASKCEELRRLGITAHIFDDGLPLENIWDLSSVTHVLHSIPPIRNVNSESWIVDRKDSDSRPTTNDSRSIDPVLQYHLDDLKNLKNLKWFGYLSTTGVYGDHKGRWVDEDTEINPPEGRSHLRAEAERAWLASGLPVHIFRLSGIYGRGRSIIDNLKAGTAHRIFKEGQVFSRIHVEDIAQILVASIAKPNPFRIYNCADDEPTAQNIIVEYAAELLGISPPPLLTLEQAGLSEMAKSFWASNRRVKNDRIKNELNMQLKYPSYKEGLQHIIKNI